MLKKLIIIWGLSLGLMACTSPDSGNNTKLEDGMASITITIPSGAKKALKNEQRAGVPSEITSIVIDVLNSAGDPLESAEIIGSEGTVTFTIVAGKNYTLRGKALAGSELLFKGEAGLAELKEGSVSSVVLRLDDQVFFAVSVLDDIEVGSDEALITHSLNGLDNILINWYVNDTLGGDNVFGFISQEGGYTPPQNLPKDTRINIRAEPFVAPSFAQSFQFNLLPANLAPVANAGVDQTVNATDVVTLTSLSLDIDGIIVASVWAVISGDFEVSILNDNSANSSFVAPNLQLDGAVTLRLTVTDNDGAVTTDDVVINVNGVDQPLVSDAGIDQSVNENTLVTLDGSGSQDPDNVISSYLWQELTSSGIALSDTSAQQPTFTAANVNSTTLLTFQLTVTNDQGNVAIDTVVITILAVDQPLVSFAGANQVVPENTQVQLNGLGSNDPDNAIVSFLWQETSAGGIVLSSTNIAQPTFTAPNVVNSTIFSFLLTVTNDLGLQATDTVSILVNPVDLALFSDAGVDQVVNELTLVTLDGTASNDPDNVITTYLWEELTAGGLVLSDSSAQQPTFTAPDVALNTIFTFRLTVTNDDGLQSMDTVSITVNNIVVLGDTVYFGARADFGNFNLWVSDGTNAGTLEVASVKIENHALAEFKTIGDYFYFQGDDGINGREVWRTDGTLLGTEFFESVDQSNYVNTGASTGSEPIAFSVLDDKLLYRGVISSVNNSNKINRYLALDTINETVSILTLDNVGSSKVNDVGIFNNESYFYANTIGPNTELLKTDGVNTATLVNVFNGFSNLRDFVEVNGELFFVFNDRELWKTDGTAVGTIQLHVFAGLVGTSNANFTGLNGLISFNNKLYFVADDGVTGRELWVSDGTVVGTVLLKDLDGAATSTNPIHFHIINGQLVFLSSEGGVASDGVWVSDGTSVGTTRISSTQVNGDIGFYNGIDTARASFVASLNLLFFTGNDGINGNELWVTDGTALGTKMVKNISSASSQPTILRPSNGFIIFGAQDDDARAKLWRSDGTDAGTTLIQDIQPGGFGNSAFFQLGD